MAGAVEYTHCISADYPHDIKQSDGETQVIMKIWGQQSTPSLLSLPGSLGPGGVTTDKVLYMQQIEMLDIQTMY